MKNKLQLQDFTFFINILKDSNKWKIDDLTKKIGKDIEQIFSLGQFKDIQVNTQQGIEGLELQFIVEEIPSIGNVEIIGNSQLENSDIREKIGLTRGATFKEHLVQEAKKEILKAYEEKGFFFAETRIDTNKGSDNLVDVVIRIREGKKVKIEKIRFSGNKAFNEKQLAEQMETTAKTWWNFLDDSFSKTVIEDQKVIFGQNFVYLSRVQLASQACAMHFLRGSISSNCLPD